MSKAIFIHETGGPEVMRWEDHDPGAPAPGEARVVHDAIGLNFIDVYHRTGLYPLPSLPAVPGLEGAGTVAAVGEGVSEVRPGDRVAYAAPPAGAYAQVRCMPAHRLVKLPEDISTRQAAGMMLQGMTARYLLKGCYEAGPESVILVTAAAGGVGSILCQWASSLGATVIGLAGSEEKAAMARANGCQHPIEYTKDDYVAAVRELTQGRGVDAVYESVGQATFHKSLECLRPMGIMVTFGQSSGPLAPFDISQLAAKGSLFLTRPSLFDYTRQREDLLRHAQDLFEVVLSGAVSINIMQEYALRDVAQAHKDLEAKKTRGSTVLIP